MITCAQACMVPRIADNQARADIKCSGAQLGGAQVQMLKPSQRDLSRSSTRYQLCTFCLQYMSAQSCTPLVRRAVQLQLCCRVVVKGASLQAPYTEPQWSCILQPAEARMMRSHTQNPTPQLQDNYNYQAQAVFMYVDGSSWSGRGLMSTSNRSCTWLSTCKGICCQRYPVGPAYRAASLAPLGT